MKHANLDAARRGPVPRVAAEIFGERLPLAVKYAELLATTGIEHGLLGPREAPKVWDRHILNCAVMESLLPHRMRLIDIGSGAGLPGIALAIARPDLRITLLEPLARRVTWLETAVQEIGLSHVTILRGRAEEMSGRIQAQATTARAVARLDRLATWAWPLLPDGGRLLAVKGQSAEGELEEARPHLERLGLQSARVCTVGDDLLSEPVRVVELIRDAGPQSASSAPTTARRSRR